ncbi:hypothetical protein HYT00_02810 [Candidatus Giovannonibacteria bacterium]|nr:hypothetical protein [Candidatus Giovannonibacteria bacterium]
MILSRTLILILILFEILNLAGFLNFTLDFSWLGLLVTSVSSLLVIELIYYFFRKRGEILPSFPYSISAVGLWVDALGDISHFYGSIAWYDQMAHFLGGAAVMALALAVSVKLLAGKTSIIFIIIIALSLTSFFGSLYEIEEYLEDAFYHKRQVRLGDGPDTANDLLLNLYGALAVGIIYALLYKKEEV